jgi:hypothetical protein
MISVLTGCQETVCDFWPDGWAAVTVKNDIAFIEMEVF